eukprot:m.59685 g.59685  ORF g.59685 m.59685 type:complete len:709 (-) comp13602_c0_seq2:287-2413(-)
MKNRSTSNPAAALSTTTTAAASTTSTTTSYRAVIETFVFFVGCLVFSIVTDAITKNVLRQLNLPITLTLAQFGASTICGLVALHLLKLHPPQSLAWPRVQKVTPLMFFQASGFLLSNVSVSAVAVSFMHTVKACESVFTAFLSYVFLKHRYSLGVYGSLLPMILGVMLSSFTELSFTMKGLLSGLGSNVCFSSRSVVSELLFREKLFDDINLYWLMCAGATIMVLPLWMWTDMGVLPGMLAALEGNGGVAVLGQLFLCGVMHFIYNIFSFMILSRTSSLTHVVLHAVRRMLVIYASILYFGNPVQTLNYVGMLLVFAGVFLYAHFRNAQQRSAAKAKDDSSSNNSNDSTANARPVSSKFALDAWLYRNTGKAAESSGKKDDVFQWIATSAGTVRVLCSEPAPSSTTTDTITNPTATPERGNGGIRTRSAAAAASSAAAVKPVLVCVPDGPCVIEHFEGLVKRFQNRYRVVVFDLPGFGLSAPAPSYDHSLQKAAQCIEEVLDALLVERAVLNFTCINGYYALAFAKRCPQRVAGLVLGQTPAPADMRAWTTRVIPRYLSIPYLGQLISYVLRHHLARYWLSVALPSTKVEQQGQQNKNQQFVPHPELAAWQSKAAAALKKGGCNCLASVVQGVDGIDSNTAADAALLTGITAPVVLLWGLKDRSHRPTDPKNFHTLVPHATVCLLPDQGHFPNLENLDALEKALNQLL